MVVVVVRRDACALEGFHRTMRVRGQEMGMNLSSAGVTVIGLAMNMLQRREEERGEQCKGIPDCNDAAHYLQIVYGALAS